MDVQELLRLKRPLTPEEAAVVEQEVLKLARELNEEIGKITNGLDPADPEVARLKKAGPNIVRNIEKAIAVDAEQLAADDAAMKRQQSAAVYSWEKLPVYEWNSRLARVTGRLLAQFPRRWLIHGHILAAQTTVISHCICMRYRELAPGDVVSAEECRSWQMIAHTAARTAQEKLIEISRLTALGRSDVAHGIELCEKIRQHFEWEQGAPGEPVRVVH